MPDGPQTWRNKMPQNNNQTYEDWKFIVDKLEKEVENAKKALIDISIAKECQEHMIEYTKKRLAEYPEPVIMAEETEEEKKKREEEEAGKTEAPAEAPSA